MANGIYERLLAAEVTHNLAREWDQSRLQYLRNAIMGVVANPVLPSVTEVETCFGTRMHIDLRDKVCQDIFVHKSYEIDISLFLAKTLTSGDVFFDIGAHYGYFSSLASVLVRPQGKVIAWEPGRRALAFLARNVEHLGNVIWRDRAVGESNGFVDYTDFGVEYGAFNTIKDNIRSPVNVEGTRERVARESLDEFFATSGVSCTVLKVDAESAESEIIKGAKELLTRNRPAVILEVGDFDHVQSSGIPDTRDLIDMMGDLRYRPYQFRTGRLEGHKIQPRGKYNYMNLIFLPVGKSSRWSIHA
ncbi:FkbM family methyltransferase [Phreatobacter oligotrophus]|uniref:FkbM family methyltransferase n=1 Tax=Phreatobacter oligotrophus TaxID=1122261 RepID=A0A2T4YP42_9HYPH|nr:FkbM family methyltransferase [Phreatobacter oligotrophus]PTM45282.1 FkbM family methyltransferase [Phreatobacter oligotrophus]